MQNPRIATTNLVGGYENRVELPVPGEPLPRALPQAGNPTLNRLR